MFYLNDDEIKNEETIKKTGIRYSKENPDHYITFHACFGIAVSIEKYLGIHAPDDSYFDWYVLNGKVKPFTKRQKITAQNATSWGN